MIFGMESIPKMLLGLKKVDYWINFGRIMVKKLKISKFYLFPEMAFLKNF